jgi:hypothetical protein
MKLYAVYTPSHEILCRRFFLPTVPPGFDVVSYEYKQSGQGNFGAPDFFQCIEFKVNKIIESIEQNPGACIVWSDVDIQFFNFSPSMIEGDLCDLDMAFQRFSRKGDDACGGFYALRCSPAVQQFFREVLVVSKEKTAGNEQDAINILLQTTSLKWGLLPWKYYARTHGFQPPSDIALHHATCIRPGDSVPQKIELLETMAWIMKNPGIRMPLMKLLNAGRVIAGKFSIK